MNDLIWVIFAALAFVVAVAIERRRSTRAGVELTIGQTRIRVFADTDPQVLAQEIVSAIKREGHQRPSPPST